MRVTIIVKNMLNKGETANVCAILMGQLATRYTSLFSKEIITDKTGFVHSGITASTIILKAQEKELNDFCLKMADDDLLQTLNVIVFTEEGQQINDDFDGYKKKIQSKHFNCLHPIGIIILGEKEAIMDLTRGFSLY